MSSPLPLRPSVDYTTETRSVFDLTEDRTEAVFAALGSETARSILAAIEGDPATASGIADRVGTSLQNVQYHLDNLEAADLVSVAGTWYSSRGTEMSVYAPTTDRVEFRLADAPAADLSVSEPVASPSTTPAVLND